MVHKDVINRMDRSRDVTVYKKWDDGFFVRSMTSDDVKIVENWYNEICPTGNDLEIALEVSDPSGKFFFVGELNGEVIASIANVPVCDDGLLYCSLFYVAEKCRKYGYGRRINDEVAGAAVGDAVVLALDSHAELEAMQKRRGCSSAFHVTLYEGRVESGTGQRSDATVKTVIIRLVHVHSILKHVYIGGRFVFFLNSCVNGEFTCS